MPRAMRLRLPLLPEGMAGPSVRMSVPSAMAPHGRLQLQALPVPEMGWSPRWQEWRRLAD